MAIYKPTYCYPHGENIDLHVDPETKAIYLQCQVNTNNKKVTGYRLSLVDANGEPVWEPKDIMPISELALMDYGDHKNDDHGLGFNGDTLIIPLVQNFSALNSSPLYISQQCLYTHIDAVVDYGFGYGDEETAWTHDWNILDSLPEVKNWNVDSTKDHQLAVGMKCFETTWMRSYVVTSSGLNTVSTPVPGYWYVRFGNTHAGWVNNGVVQFNVVDWLQYIDSYSNGVAVFKSLGDKVRMGQEYSWSITLYQGDITIAKTTASYSGPAGTSSPWGSSTAYYVRGAYSNSYNENQYDIMIAQGQILGSNGSRLQIYPTDVVLQKYWVQLGTAVRNASGVITSWSQYGNRSNIQIYDSIYGHIYPQEDDFEENIIEQNPTAITDCMVYKHSNNPDDVQKTEKVTVATTTDVNVTNLIYMIFGGGLPIIDSYEVQAGDLVLVKDLKGYEYLNGVYVASDTGNFWKRSGSYSDWSQYIGKVLLVENGAQNSWQNFESTATAGGTIGRVTGLGIDAVRPYVARQVIGYNSSTFTFKEYNFDGTRWVGVSDDRKDFNQFVTDYSDQYVFMINETSSGFPGSGGSRFTAPSRYFIPSSATYDSEKTWEQNFEQFQTAAFTAGSDIAWVNSLSTSTGPGFLSFSDYEAEGVNANTYLWNVNALDASYYGSSLGFRPEQGIVLYAQYENLTTPPSSYYVDYIYVGDPVSSSTGSNITTYSLAGTQAGSDISNLIIDRVNGSELPTGTTIASYTQSSAPYSQDLSGQYPIQWIFDAQQMPGSSYNSPPSIHTLRVSNGMVYPGEPIPLSTTPLYYLGYDSALNTWTIYKMYYYELSYFSYAVSIDPVATINVATKVYIYAGVDTHNYMISPSSTVLTPNPTATITIGIYTVNNNHTLSSIDSKGSGSSASTISPPILFHALHGLVCGGESFLTVGTWGNPQIQIGITNRVAKLNINNATTTYIKPATGIEPGQYMVFTEANESPRKIATFDDKEYAVTFNPSTSTVYSSVKNDELKTPYKYKIMSYFKQGDYNPFIFSGEAKIGFAIPKSSTQYTIAAVNGATQQFILDGTTYAVPMEYSITVGGSVGGNGGLTLDGFFNQGNGQRWRSYRMAIYSSKGELLQDTGEVYEGDISQTLWGLRVQSGATTRTLYCVLIVEDYYNDKYVVGATINVTFTYSGPSCSATIQYNYNLQTIDLDIVGGDNFDENDFYTIYKQEYRSDITTLNACDTYGYVFVARQHPIDGHIKVCDYNITNGRKYLYFLQHEISSPTSKTVLLNAALTSPIPTPGKCWSVAELIPTSSSSGMEGVSTVHQYYVVDSDQVWLFKYNAEFGSQNQNFAKSENQTLGKYPRMGHGLRNNISGQVSALLGSEIKPGTSTNADQPGGYRERLRSVRVERAAAQKSSNDSIDLLNAWREIAYSKNPKLLKDVKGQSWIVQITSNQNTPKSQVDGRPDTISFSWTQIDDPEGMAIIGDLDTNINGDYK